MHVLDALGDWQKRHGPLYRRLAEALADAIAAGDLAAGQSLPAERALAGRLAVGRSTVVGAYDVLRSQGLLESRQGAGTWVAGASRIGQSDPSSPEALRAAISFAPEQLIDLATASLPADPAVAECLSVCATEPDPEVLASPGYFRLGLPVLRERLASNLSAAGLATSADQVLITTGEQQALSLLAEHYLSAGDVAVVTDPTSPGILDVLRALPVTIRAGGSLSRSNGIAELSHVLERGESQLLYLSPTIDHETGRLSAHGRDHLVKTLRSYRGVVVIDEAQRSLTFDKPLPFLSVGRAAPTCVTVGSFSKLYWGGLRVGWMRGPTAVVARLSRTKARADLGTPVISQMIAAELVTREQEVRQRRLAVLRSQLKDAHRLLATHLPGFDFAPPMGGLTIWAKLPSGLSEPFAQTALRYGVAVAPGSMLSQGGAGDEFIRIAFARPQREFEEGTRRLAEAWEWFSRHQTSIPHLEHPWLG